MASDICQTIWSRGWLHMAAAFSDAAFSRSAERIGPKLLSVLAGLFHLVAFFFARFNVGDGIPIFFDPATPARNTAEFALKEVIKNEMGDFLLSAPLIALFPAAWLWRFCAWRRRREFGDRH